MGVTLAIAVEARVFQNFRAEADVGTDDSSTARGRDAAFRPIIANIAERLLQVTTTASPFFRSAPLD